MRINFGSHVFAVPGVVVDHFIRIADETQIKVLLCFLRSDGNATAGEIAAYLKLTPEQVEEALEFWMQANILDTGSETASGFTFAAPVPIPVQQQPVQPAATATPPVPAEVIVRGSSKEVKLDPTEIEAMLEQTPSLKDLFMMAEKLMGTPPNHMDQRSLIWMSSYLHLPSEVILTLLGYCISIGKYSIKYAESIAISWEQKGITTFELAEEEIERLRTAHTYEAELRRIFEMKRSPTPKQKAYFDQWKAAGYSLELLQYAYEIGVENTEKLNFPYMDKILTNWSQSGITTPEQAKAQPKPQYSGKSAPRGKAPAPMTQEEIDEMNDYLSVVNRFKEDES